MPSSDDVAMLIAKLADSDFHVRRDAASQLRDIGQPALPKLKEAAQGKDPEIRARAGELVHILEYQPVPGRPRHYGHIRQHSSSSTHTLDGHQSIEINDEGRKILITNDEDGIKMTVSGEINGQPATRTYSARTPEQLRNDNPEAFTLYQRYAQGGGDDDFDGAIGNIFLQGNGNVVILPGRFQVVPVIVPPIGGEDLIGLRNQVDRDMDKANLPPLLRAKVRGAIDHVEQVSNQNVLIGPGNQQDDQIARYENACDDLRKVLSDNHLPDPGDALPPPKSARLGIQIEPDPLSGTLTVTHVLPNSRAARIGLRDNDVICKINDKEIGNIKDLRSVITENTKGLVVNVTRDGKDVELKEPK